MPEIHIGLVELSGLITGLIFWFARLEFKTNQVDLLWKKINSLETQINERLSNVERTLARIEGFLSKDHL
jgi:hypothetical protein